MGIFDEVAAAQQRERQRESIFARFAADFAQLSRADQVTLLARLANLVEGDRSPAPVPAGPRPEQTRLHIRALTPVIPKPEELIPATPTSLVRRVVHEANAPLGIDEIVVRVLTLNPSTKKGEIYSAVYKRAKAGEFIKNSANNTYSRNANYRRAEGGEQ